MGKYNNKNGDGEYCDYDKKSNEYFYFFEDSNKDHIEKYENIFNKILRISI